MPNSVDLTANPFCAISDVQDFLSLRGMIAGSDHESTGIENEDLINKMIQRASMELAGVLFPRYTLTELAKSSLVRDWTAVVASYHLMTTGGNPPPAAICSEFMRIMGIEGDGSGGLVKRVQDGKFTIPNINPAATSIPVWSNLEVDRRFKHETIRVVSASSSKVAKQEIERDELPGSFLER